jgi:hypothetical protein
LFGCRIGHSNPPEATGEPSRKFAGSPVFQVVPIDSGVRSAVHS